MWLATKRELKYLEQRVTKLLLLFIMLHKVLLTSLRIKNPSVWPFKWKLLSSTFMVLFIMLYKVILAFKSVGRTLVYDNLIESYWAVVSCGAITFAILLKWNSHFWLRIRIVLIFVCHTLDAKRLQHKLDSHPFASFSWISSRPWSPVLALSKLRKITNIY